MVQKLFEYNDGGRGSAGYKGDTGDCGVRAAAIAMGRPYKEVYDELNTFCENEKKSKTRKGKSSSRTGIHRVTYSKFLETHGWRWVPTMKIGSGCKVHLRKDELPSGRLIVRLSRHYSTVVDGVVYDTYDCSREGTRCVYGYWTTDKKIELPDGVPVLPVIMEQPQKVSRPVKEKAAKKREKTKFSKLEWEIIEDRLGMPDCIGDALGDSGWDGGEVEAVAYDLHREGREGIVLEECNKMEIAILKDCCEGSTVFHSLPIESDDRKSLLGAAKRLERKIGVPVNVW